MCESGVALDNKCRVVSGNGLVVQLFFFLLPRFWQHPRFLPLTVGNPDQVEHPLLLLLGWVHGGRGECWRASKSFGWLGSWILSLSLARPRLSMKYVLSLSFNRHPARRLSHVSTSTTSTHSHHHHSRNQGPPNVSSITKFSNRTKYQNTTAFLKVHAA